MLLVDNLRTPRDFYKIKVFNAKEREHMPEAKWNTKIGNSIYVKIISYKLSLTLDNTKSHRFFLATGTEMICHSLPLGIVFEVWFTVYFSVS